MPQLRLIKISERLVHRAAVVPNEDVVLAPLVAVDEFRPRRVPVQVFDQRAAFFFGHAVEAFHFLAKVERLAPGLGMHAHHRLRDRRVDAFLFGGVRGGSGIVADFPRAGQMNAVQIGDQLLHAFRQRVVGHGHVGEQRVAADFRQVVAAQQRAHRRMRRVGKVRMPLAAGVAAARRRAVRVGPVGDQQQLRIIRMPVAGQRVVPVQLAEAAAELDVLLAA